MDQKLTNREVKKNQDLVFQKKMVNMVALLFLVLKTMEMDLMEVCFVSYLLDKSSEA